MGTKSKKPDVRHLREADLKQLDFPGSGREDFRVFMTPAVHDEIARHAADNPSLEVCGVLVGRWGQDRDGPFVAITEVIRCDSAASTGEQVTFTHDTWAEIAKQMDTRFADLDIVGWYHSHPDFGVFLSERDFFIHEHFFSNPGQVAFVVDPVRKTEGMFVWHRGKLDTCTHYWVGQRIYSCFGMGDEAARAEAKPAPGEARAGAGDERADEQPVSLGPLLARALGYVAALVIGYLLARVPTAWQQQKMLEGIVAHFAAWKVIRIGLEDYLVQMNTNLNDVASALQRLGPEHIRLAGQQADQRRADYEKLYQRIRATQNLLSAARSRYCLDPTEQAILWKLSTDTLTGRAITPRPVLVPEKKQKADTSEADSAAQGEGKTSSRQ